MLDSNRYKVTRTILIKYYKDIKEYLQTKLKKLYNTITDTFSLFYILTSQKFFYPHIFMNLFFRLGLGYIFKIFQSKLKKNNSIFGIISAVFYINDTKFTKKIELKLEAKESQFNAYTVMESCQE